MESLLQLNTWLTEARAARHALLTGVKEVSVSYEGKSVSFTAADINRLEAYIGELEGKIAVLTTTQRRRGPIHFSF